MVTAVTRSSPYPDHMVDQSPRDDLYSSERQRRPGHLDEPQTQISSEDLVTKTAIRKDGALTVEPLHSDFAAVGINCWFVWPEENWSPDWAWFLPRFFSPFCHQWSFGSLPLSPLASLVGDTSFPAISPTWLHKYYLNWTELDDDITEFNNEMPLLKKNPILILCSCFDTICIVKSAI